MENDRFRNEKYLLSSVNNALKILEVLMVRDNISLKELTDITGLDKTSIFKMLYTLQYRGFIEKKDHAKYKLGRKLSSYAGTAATRQSLIDAAQPYIFRLWANTQQTVTLSVLSANGKVIIMGIKIEKGQNSIHGRIGAEMESYTSATGKVLLANLDPDIQEKMLRTLRLTPYTPKTITDPEALRRQLIRLRGEAVVDAFDENRLGHSDVAAPIYDYDGSCIAALALVFHTEMRQDHLPFYRQQVQNAAVQLSIRMGYRGYDPPTQAAE